MSRLSIVLAFVGGVVVLSAQAQATRFEVASIKRNNSGATAFTGGLSPDGRFNLTNAPTATLIRIAHPTSSAELIGAPEWVTLERYDVAAIAGPETTREEMQEMVRALLDERFKLRLHREMRERPTFLLVPARTDRRLGPEIRRSDYDCAATEAAVRSRKPVPPAANGAPACGMVESGGTFRAGGLSMDLLARMLSRRAGRVVIDKTGLSDPYEFTLRYSTQPQPLDGVASIFTALQEQLGLKFEPSRDPVETIRRMNGVSRASRAWSTEDPLCDQPRPPRRPQASPSAQL
jgi:uncharacterized protein (TIGR03435 family)